MIRHSQHLAQVKAIQLLTMAGAVPPAQLAAPATPGVSKSIPRNSQFRSNGTSKTERGAATIAVTDKLPSTEAAIRLPRLLKSP